MDWLYYLANKKINVSLPLASNNNSLVVSTEDAEKHYIISAFNKANGVFWDKNDLNKWNEKIFFNWGKVMGDIHRLTKTYKPSGNDRRPEFDGRFALMDSYKTIPSVKVITEDLVNEILTLPQNTESYGLIHADLHPWNFLIDGEKINVFDFDDSIYGWFVLDIGIALYHALWWGLPNDINKKNDFVSIIIKNFIDGYQSSNKLNNFWLSKIPMFMKYRQICAFSWFFNPQNIDDDQKSMIHNIEKNILFSDCHLDDSFFK